MKLERIPRIDPDWGSHYLQPMIDKLLDLTLEDSPVIDFTKPVVTIDGKSVVIDTLTAIGPYPVIGHIENEHQLYRWTRFGTGELFPTPKVKQASVPETHLTYLNIYTNGMGSTVFKSVPAVFASKRKGRTKIGVLANEVTILDGKVINVKGNVLPLPAAKY